MQQLLVLLEKGGIVMIPLLLCSIFMFAIGLERFWFYHKAQTPVVTLLAKLTPLFAAGNWQQAIQVCEFEAGVVAKVIAAGLTDLIVTHQVTGLANSLEGAAAHWAAKLRQRLNYLDMIVTLSPLLGLLGTVTGMINTFNVLTIQAGQPAAITGGIGEALIATATGLCIAIIALVIHSIFSQWLDNIITDIEEACTTLIDYANRMKNHEAS
jgi:biopolymer transport protein ExbB